MTAVLILAVVFVLAMCVFIDRAVRAARFPEDDARRFEPRYTVPGFLALFIAIVALIGALSVLGVELVRGAFS